MHLPCFRRAVCGQSSASTCGALRRQSTGDAKAAGRRGRAADKTCIPALLAFSFHTLLCGAGWPARLYLSSPPPRRRSQARNACASVIIVCRANTPPTHTHTQSHTHAQTHGGETSLFQGRGKRARVWL